MDKELKKKLDACTDKQRVFVKEYIKNSGNGSAAAEKAYNLNNSNTAKSVGSENLAKPDIANAIAKWREILATEADISHKKIVNALTYVAQQNVDMEPSTMIKATSEINKMMGYHKDSQTLSDALDDVRDLAGINRKKRLDKE